MDLRRNLGIPKGYQSRKKVRGSKRKLRSFERKLQSIAVDIPSESFARDKVWHYHLPNPSKLVDSTHSSHKLRRKFLGTLTETLAELDRTTKGKYRALLLVSLPFLSKSRIDICIDPKHFEKLVSSTDSPQDWKTISAPRNIVEELHLVLLQVRQDHR